MDPLPSDIAREKAVCMTQRHSIQSNQTMLITTVTHARNPYFQDDALAREAVEHIYRVQERRPFFLYGFVIMPDHVHLLLNVPEPETVSNILRLYKMGLSFQTGITPLWQKRFDARISGNVFGAREYVHLNPVREGLCTDPKRYPWSSASGKWDVTEWRG